MVEEELNIAMPEVIRRLNQMRMTWGGKITALSRTVEATEDGNDTHLEIAKKELAQAKHMRDCLTVAINTLEGLA